MTRAESVDKLKDANKKLRAQVRQLRKQNKQLDAELELLRELWAADIQEMRKERRKKVTKKRTPVCPQCGNPTLDIKQVGIWKLIRCESCDHFERTQEE